MTRKNQPSAEQGTRMHVRKWGWFLSSSLLIFAGGIAAGSLTGCGATSSSTTVTYVCGFSTVLTVHGIVVDPRNRPLAGYSVSINNEDRITTNTAGEYSIEIDAARIITTGNTFRVYDLDGVLAHIESRRIGLDSCSVHEADLVVGPPQPPTTP